MPRISPHGYYLGCGTEAKHENIASKGLHGIEDDNSARLVRHRMTVVLSLPVKHLPYPVASQKTEESRLAFVNNLRLYCDWNMKQQSTDGDDWIAQYQKRLSDPFEDKTDYFPWKRSIVVSQKNLKKNILVDIQAMAAP